MHCRMEREQEETKTYSEERLSVLQSFVHPTSGPFLIILSFIGFVPKKEIKRLLPNVYILESGSFVFFHSQFFLSHSLPDSSTQLNTAGRVITRGECEAKDGGHYAFGNVRNFH